LRRVERAPAREPDRNAAHPDLEMAGRRSVRSFGSRP
jgi:hypothetical protein